MVSVDGNWHTKSCSLAFRGTSMTRPVVPIANLLLLYCCFVEAFFASWRSFSKSFRRGSSVRRVVLRMYLKRFGGKGGGFQGQLNEGVGKAMIRSKCLVVGSCLVRDSRRSAFMYWSWVQGIREKSGISSLARENFS